ncbi:MAG: transposase [Verrucomicrobiales bacterium]|nr:transposase [Verrucomicrobiales bacterium]
MARPLRIQVAGGWYHVTSRGNRREAIYRTDTDRRRFLGLVAELPERSGLEVHAFVLMDNHYHLVVRTPEPNLGEAMHWLHVSYTSRFNWAHRQCGHLFQGRYKAVLIEDPGGVAAVARYVHLNPVRVGRLGLGKTQQRQSRAGGGVDPGAALVQQRLHELNEYPWSSWRVYGGAEPAPGWLETGVIGAGCGGRSREQQRQALREYTEAPVREGRLDSPWSGLVGGLVLGGKEYAQALLKGLASGSVDPEAQTAARQIARADRIAWAEIVAIAERLRGRRWPEMAEDWGDWGRDGTIYVAVRHGRHRLAEVVRAVGGLTYGAAAQAVRRFTAGMPLDAARIRFVEEMRRRLGERREKP